MICNSLGSNYSFKFCLQSLSQILFSSNKNTKKLKKFLEKKFNGQTYLFYKGRDAIEYCLRCLNLKPNDEILIQAFTCYSIEEAIKRAELKPIYTDITNQNLNPNLETLEKAWIKAKNPKALLIQHTLGIPADIEKIKAWCKQKNLILIEDLAQAYGGKNINNKELGSFADIVILSFGRDKIIDAVTGGACIIRIKYKPICITDKISTLQIIKELLYPITTYLIRNTYSFFLGKIIHYLSVKTKIMTSPIQSLSKNINLFPKQFSSLVLIQLNNFDQNFKHRKSIFSFYQKNLPKNIQLKDKNLINGSCLRFPILINNIPKLNELLENQNNIHLSDRWYRKAVDCGNTKCQSNYIIGDCPNAENLAKTIYNLPTHQYIKIKDAKKIVHLIKCHCELA